MFLHIQKSKFSQDASHYHTSQKANNKGGHLTYIDFVVHAWIWNISHVGSSFEPRGSYKVLPFQNPYPGKLRGNLDSWAPSLDLCSRNLNTKFMSVTTEGRPRSKERTESRNLAPPIPVSIQEYDGNQCTYQMPSITNREPEVRNLARPVLVSVQEYDGDQCIYQMPSITNREPEVRSLARPVPVSVQEYDGDQCIYQMPCITNREPEVRNLAPPVPVSIQEYDWDQCIYQMPSITNREPEVRNLASPVPVSIQEYDWDQCIYQIKKLARELCFRIKK